MNIDINIDNVITIIGYLISGFVGYKVSKTASKSTIELESIKTQFYSVYLPLFKAFENNLYKEIDKQTAISYIELFRDIKSNYYEHIDSSLLSLFNNLEKYIDMDSLVNYYFSSICYIVDKQYEKLKKKLFLPKRDFLYKFTHNQFPKDILNSIKYFFNGLSKILYVLFLMSISIYIVIFVEKAIHLILLLFTQ